jgi:hypothetical protein
MKSKSNRKGENTMSSTANATTIDSKKPNTKQELIAANIKVCAAARVQLYVFARS